MIDATVLDGHRELAIMSLDSTAWQLQSAARLLHLGDDRQAITAYRRAVTLIKEHASTDMRAIAEALDKVGQVAPVLGQVAPKPLTAPVSTEPGDAVA